MSESSGDHQVASDTRTKVPALMIRCGDATIRDSADSLLHVINDILDISKIEAGKLLIEQVQFDFRSTVEEVGVLLGAAAARKNLELVVRYASDVPHTLRGDPVRLRQVLTNFVSNAVKFTGSGHVMVEVHCAERTGDDVVMQVDIEDTGIGIPQDKVSSLFEKFSQADSSTTRQFGGTGLGLPISKALVELMGGTAWAVSTPGVGSRFSFTFRARVLPEPQADVRTDLDHMRVLVVDSNALSRGVLTSRLEQWGIRTTSVATGRQALVTLDDSLQNGEPFALAILEHHLPDADGIGLARLIKSDPQTRGLAIALEVTHGQQFDLDELRQGDLVVGVLLKPIRQSDLLNLLIETDRKHGVESPAPDRDLPEQTLTTGRKSLRVLLVEDNAINAEVGTTMLQTLGCEVTLAHNGLAAIKKLAQTNYDIVFMDCHMPEMDGFDATRHIRAMEGDKRHTHIVAMTANAMQGDRQRCIDAGMDDYIGKPVTLAGLKALVDERRAQRASARCEDGGQQDQSEGERPVFDRAGALAAMGGQQALLRRTVAMFRSAHAGWRQTLRAAIDTGDLSAALREAHSMKSAAASIGAMAVADVAMKIESAIRTERLALVPELLDALDCEAARLDGALADAS